MIERARAFFPQCFLFLCVDLFYSLFLFSFFFGLSFKYSFTIRISYSHFLVDTKKLKVCILGALRIGNITLNRERKKQWIRRNSIWYAENWFCSAGARKIFSVLELRDELNVHTQKKVKTFVNKIIVWLYVYTGWMMMIFNSFFFFSSISAMACTMQNGCITMEN